MEEEIRMELEGTSINMRTEISSPTRGVPRLGMVEHYFISPHVFKASSLIS
jgi:hypothetical protein